MLAANHSKLRHVCFPPQSRHCDRSVNDPIAVVQASMWRQGTAPAFQTVFDLTGQPDLNRTWPSRHPGSGWIGGLCRVRSA